MTTASQSAGPRAESSPTPLPEPVLPGSGRAGRVADPELRSPAGAGGLMEVVHHRYLLKLLLRRELKARYKGSLLGLGWSYVRPAVNFGVFYFVVGVFMGMDKVIKDFPIYLFSGLVLVTLFTETLQSATRSVLHNAPLVRKVYLPRELFPSASLLVSLVHFLPALAILVAGALSYGWRPTLTGMAGAAVGLLIVVLFALGLGLLCAAATVFFHDVEQVVDIVMITVSWTVPMVYPWIHVRDHAPHWVLQVWQLNPLVSAVELFHRGFWGPLSDGRIPPPPALTTRTISALGLAFMFFFIGEAVFARLQKRFAQEM